MACVQQKGNESWKFLTFALVIAVQGNHPQTVYRAGDSAARQGTHKNYVNTLVEERRGRSGECSSGVKNTGSAVELGSVHWPVVLSSYLNFFRH